MRQAQPWGGFFFVVRVLTSSAVFAGSEVLAPPAAEAVPGAAS